VERLPSGTCVLDLPRNRSSRFEAFSAVYRAPGLFSTALVMNFQSFADGLSVLAAVDPFAIRFFAFHARADSRHARYLSALGQLPFQAWFPMWDRGLEGADILGFTAAFLRGLGFFSPSDVTIQSTLSSRFYRKAP